MRRSLSAAPEENKSMFRNLGAWWNSLQSDPLGTLIEIVMMIAALLLSLILHEIGHGYVALKCGDPTAKMMGRLTLDPRKHLDPIGAICMFFLGIGWAKPVPINPYNFKKRDRDMVLVSFAGIFVNLVLFVVSSLLFSLVITASGNDYIYKLLYSSNQVGLYSMTGNQVLFYLSMLLWFFMTFNISLAVFNLIPVPPLDGFRLVNQIFFRGQLNLSGQTMQIIHFGFLFICLSGMLSNTFSRIIEFCIKNTVLLFLGGFA